jgi:hypothetical protein
MKVRKKASNVLVARSAITLMNMRNEGQWEDCIGANGERNSLKSLAGLSYIEKPPIVEIVANARRRLGP